MLIGEQEIYVVHFSTVMSIRNITYPGNLLAVVQDPDGFCLSCSAFTKEMLCDPTFTPPGGGTVGLMLEASFETEPSEKCCEIGLGNIRAVLNSDLGKSDVGDVPCLPCSPILPGSEAPTPESALASLMDVGDHNEWILKPPHNIVGFFLFGTPNEEDLNFCHEYLPEVPIFAQDYNEGLIKID